MDDPIKRKPELLAPAGDFEKLAVAVTYGADAVYIGGQQFGLRAGSKNFDMPEMRRGVDFAHAHGVRVYVTANIFAHQPDIEQMADYFSAVHETGADALIVSDPGVFALAREAVPDMEIHISTQANTTNARAALFWQRLGAKRIVLARELSLTDIREIRAQLPDGFEIETFVHGAMCMSYSGRCLLSHYLTGRDANKGECAQPCRWQYELVEQKRPGEPMPVFEDARGTYIFNSKDLCLVEHIPALIDAGIHSFKIEGRMKTPYYVGTVVNAYRRAIDDYFLDPALYESHKASYAAELAKTSHRHFTTGFYFAKSDEHTQHYGSSAYARTYEFVGMVLDYDNETKTAVIEQRNKFSVGETVEILRARGPFLTHTIKEMTNNVGEPVAEAPHPQQVVRLKIPQPLMPYDMLRRAVAE